MNDILLLCIIVAILGAAIWYMIAKKQKGQTCLGCSCGCTHAGAGHKNGAQGEKQSVCASSEDACLWHNKE